MAKFILAVIYFVVALFICHLSADVMVRLGYQKDANVAYVTAVATVALWIAIRGDAREDK
jgi:ACR3 family arsenite efflux pump ArsB